MKTAQKFQPKALVILLIMAITTAYLTWFLKRIPYSLFYEMDIAKLERDQHHRREWALSYLKQKKMHAGWQEGSELCVGILSAPREHEFLSQTVAHLLDATPVDANVSIFVFSPRGKPANAQIAQHVKVVSPDTVDAKEDVDWHQRQILDFARLFTFVDSLTCPYVLLLEDDVIPAKSYYTSLSRDILANPKVRASDIGYVKLFFTRVFAGWSFESVSDMIIIMSVASLTTFASGYLLRPSRKTGLVIYLIVFLYTCFILLAVGKQNWVSLISERSGLIPFTGMTSSPAHLYPHHLMKPLADYFSDKWTQTRPSDFLIDDFMIEHALKRYEFLPHLFQHIGLYSSSIARNQGNYENFIMSYDFRE
jgi:hypothetical protein